MAGVHSLVAYCDCVPEENQWKLDKRIDFEHDRVQTHLGAIADAMDEWEGRVAEALGLDTVNISSIKTKIKDNLNLQTYVYRLLLKVFVEGVPPTRSNSNDICVNPLLFSRCFQ